MKFLGDKAPEIAESYIKELEGNIQFVESRLKGLKMNNAQRCYISLKAQTY